MEGPVGRLNTICLENLDGKRYFLVGGDEEESVKQ